MTDPPSGRLTSVALHDRIAGDYFDRWDRPVQRYTRRIETRWLTAALADINEPKVLLAGSGGARELEALLPLGAHVTAVDESQAMLDAGRARWGEAVTWLAGDVHDLSRLPHDFDAAISLAAINYFREPGVALTQIVSRLRP